MQYWNELLTERSWQILQDLKKEKFNFILIGGWAAYLWAKSHKSKDIDIVVDFQNLEKIKEKYLLKKNQALKKYEIIIEEIDIDIYVPYFSKLAIPLEEVKKHTTKIENFTVVNAEILLILKQGAELQRGESEKGEKDRIDIMDLLLTNSVNYENYYELLKKYKLDKYSDRLINIIKKFKEPKYFTLNPREFKLKKNEMLNKLKKI